VGWRKRQARGALSPASRVLLHGPAGPISLKTVHWTVFRALDATAVGKQGNADQLSKRLPISMGSWRRRRLRGSPSRWVGGKRQAGGPYPPLRGYFPTAVGKQEKCRPALQRLPISMGSWRRRRLRGSPLGGLAENERKRSPIPRFAGTSPLRWGSKGNADQLSKRLPIAMGSCRRRRLRGSPLGGLAENGRKRCPIPR